MSCPIKMNTKEDVVRVSEIAADAGIAMSVHCGADILDPRSILGLFTLIGKDVLLVAPDGLNPQYFMGLVREMGVAA